jgi:hypothetical protein
MYGVLGGAVDDRESDYWFGYVPRSESSDGHCLLDF